MLRLYTFSIVAFATLALAACGADAGNQSNGEADGTVAGTVTIEPEGIEGTVTCLVGEPLAGVRMAIVSGTVTFPEIAPETDAEGHYRLTKRNVASDYFLSIEISYPNAQDTREARSRGVNPGGQIMIHGQANVPKFSDNYYRWNDWTEGCIALSNADMVDVWLMTTAGTPIQIDP